MKKLVVALFALALASSPSTGVVYAADGLREEVAELKRRVLELQKQAAVSQVEIARLRERLIELELERRSGDGSRAAPAPSPVEDRALIEPPRVIQIGEIEDTESSAAEQPAAPAEPIARAPRRDAEVIVIAEETAASAGAGAEPDATDQPQDDQPQDNGTPTPAEGEAIYDRGYTLYHQAQYVEAEASFQRFLQTFPDTELADNALYWIGEARFARRDFRGALAAFRETANRYPRGNKVADALLKAGASLEQLGDAAGARQSYREIQRRFPDSALAIVAEERIARLP
jgi:tol-pal system protein YbgF